jgi:hypothetical protein
MLDLDPTRWSGGEEEGVRDEAMQIEGGQMEEENGRWKTPSCVCITPCPCYMMARNFPTKCDLPNGHLSAQMPRNKLKNLQAGGRMLMLEVHWDNHSWMEIRRALDRNAPPYRKDHWKKMAPIVGQISKFVKQNYAQRRADGTLESIEPYSMALALDSIAIMLKSETDLKITEEMIEGLRTHRPIGNTPPWS